MYKLDTVYVAICSFENTERNGNVYSKTLYISHSVIYTNTTHPSAGLEYQNRLFEESRAAQLSSERFAGNTLASEK